MPNRLKIILLFLVVLALGVGIYFVSSLGHETTDDANIEAHVITMSPRVSGYIAKVNIKDNQFVKKGDVLVEIDPRDYQLQLDAKKALASSALAGAKNAETNAKRQKALGRVAASQKELDNAVTMQDVAAELVENAKAQLAIAEKNLADTKIIAPDDGIVTLRTVEVGAYVAPGQTMFSLVTPDRWVVANYKENQITDMQPGQKASIHIDAYPDLKIEGVVDSIQQGTGGRFSAFPAENATGNFVKIVQRIPVKIAITSKLKDDLVLGAGLSVVTTVYTGDKHQQPQ